MIIVASVSCIYGLGSPEDYHGMLALSRKRAWPTTAGEVLRKLVEIQYERNDIDFHRGTFRVRGDVVEVFPAYEEDRAIRIEFLGDEVERHQRGRPAAGQDPGRLEQGRPSIRPATMSLPDTWSGRPSTPSKRSWRSGSRCFEEQGKLLEAQRIWSSAPASIWR